MAFRVRSRWACVGATAHRRGLETVYLEPGVLVKGQLEIRLER